MSSLRERRRQKTEQAIRHAAIDLAYEHGLDNVTTEMITKAAGISLRTFFNYFPYKEAAFLPPPINFRKPVVDRFINGKGYLLDDVVALFEAHNTEIVFDRDTFKKNHEISLNNPKLMALKLSAFEGFDKEIGSLLAARLGVEKDSLDICHKSALIMTSVRIGLEAWITANDFSVLSDSVSERILALKGIFNEE